MLATTETKRNAFDARRFHSGAATDFVPLVGGSQKTVLSSEGRGWRNIGAAQIMNFKEDHIVAPPLPNHIIMLCLAPSLNVRAQIGGERFERRVSAGESSILPAGMASDWRVRAERLRGKSGQDAGVLQMFLRPEFLKRVALGCAVEITGGQLKTDFGAADAQTRSLGLMLLAELKQTDVLSCYRADLLAELLAVHLLSINAPAAPKTRYKGGLPPAKLRRVTEFIRANLNGALDLCELAGTVEMNAFHFARMFKQATGLPPHQFVVRERIERAKRLLAETKMPLIEISLEVGINSQNHFTTLFRRCTGQTPRQYRDNHS